jgi:GNAT superfamily N-acetyltransferase
VPIGGGAGASAAAALPPPGSALASLDALLVRQLGPFSPPAAILAAQAPRSAEGGSGGAGSASASSAFSGGSGGAAAAAAHPATPASPPPRPLEAVRFVALAPDRSVAGAVVVERIRAGAAARALPPDAPGAPLRVRLSPERRGVAERGGEAGAGGSEGTEAPAASLEGGDGEAALPSAVLGVAQVWVSPLHRRRGLGGALLDAAAAHALYACPLPRGALAFSQPTGDGAALAAAWTGEARFWI